jgi:hypothetical protein
MDYERVSKALAEMLDIGYNPCVDRLSNGYFRCA